MKNLGGEIAKRYYEIAFPDTENIEDSEAKAEEIIAGIKRKLKSGGKS